MTSNRTVAQRFADWQQANNAIRADLTPQALREMVALTKTDDVNAINLGVVMAKIVFANDRAAGIIASILTAGGGIRTIPVEDPD